MGAGASRVRGQIIMREVILRARNRPDFRKRMIIYTFLHIFLALAVLKVKRMVVEKRNVEKIPLAVFIKDIQYEEPVIQAPNPHYRAFLQREREEMTSLKKFLTPNSPGVPDDRVTVREKFERFKATVMGEEEKSYIETVQHVYLL